jgi:hypothetical protein
MATPQNISIVLLYEPATAKGRPVPLARIESYRLIEEVARVAIREASDRADILAAADEILGEVERAEVERLRHVIEILIAPLKAEAPTKDPTANMLTNLLM